MATTLYKNPVGNRIPHSGTDFKATWIKMSAKEIKSQTTMGRGTVSTTKIGSGPVFKFLAPNNLNETISHEWEAYESMQSRLAEKVRGVVRLAEDTKAIAGLTKSATGATKKTLDVEDFSGKNALGGALSLIDRQGLGKTITPSRIDTPLVYSTSSRREYNLTFQLVAGKDPLKEVVEPIKQLMRYSSPETEGSSIFIKFPWVFELRSEPGGLIYVKNAALTSVQPTWREPYKNGYPTSAELTLVFKDLAPLFGNLIETSDRVRTS